MPHSCSSCEVLVGLSTDALSPAGNCKHSVDVSMGPCDTVSVPAGLCLALEPCLCYFLICVFNGPQDLLNLVVQLSTSWGLMVVLSCWVILEFDPASRQMFYHLSHAQSPFYISYFSSRVSYFCPVDPPIYTSRIARMTCVHHHIHLYWLRWGLPNF
jgi:hypothetical protein